MFHSVLDYLFLKTFGCACWPNLWPYNSHKLQPRSLQCVFLGYSFLHHSYKCIHIPTGRLYISRDVIFLENLFPFFQNISTLPTQPITPSGQSVSIFGPCPLLSSQARSCPAPSTTSASASRASSSLHTKPIIEPIPNPQPELILAPNTQTHTVSLSNPHLLLLQKLPNLQIRPLPPIPPILLLIPLLLDQKITSPNPSFHLMA